MSRVKMKWIALAALLAAGLFLFLSLRGGKGVEVKTVVVTRGDMEVTVTPTETGTLETEETALIKAEVAAPIVSLPVSEGDKVKAGDLIARLDDKGARAELAMAQARLKASEAKLTAAGTALKLEREHTVNTLKEGEARLDDVRQRYDRQKELFAKGALSRSAMETLASELKTAEARYDEAKGGESRIALKEQEFEAARAEVTHAGAALAVARLALEKTRIEAPLDGTVTERFVKFGELVLPGAPVARIARYANLYVKALIDEVDLSHLKTGQEARITFDILPGKSYRGTLFEISPAVSTERLKSRSVAVKIALTEKLPELRPGMSADVEIITASLKGVLSVPTETVMVKDGDAFVYLVDGRGRVEQRPVRTGISSWDRTEVLSGLQGGETVITTLDAMAVKPGVKVSPSGE